MEGTIQRRHYLPNKYIETIKIKGVLVFLESRTAKPIDLNRVAGDSSEIFKILMEDGSIFTFNSNSDSIYNYNRNGSRSSSLRVSWLSEKANSLITSFERLFSALTNANQTDYQNNPNNNSIVNLINIRSSTLNGMLDEFTDSTN